MTLAFGLKRWRRRARINRMTDAILSNTPIGIAILDIDRTIRRANRQYCAIYGVEEAELIGKPARILYRSQEQFDDIGTRAYGTILAGGTFDEDVPMVRADGSELWLHLTARLIDAQDASAGVVWAVEDVTGRKAAEARIQRLTNLLSALSQCNQTIVRARSEEDLFPMVCQAAVEFGGMKMAWIGLLDETGKGIRLVSSYGDDTGFLDYLKTSADGADPRGRGSTGTSIRENRPYWCQDFRNDPAMAPWSEDGARIGCLALASLPLRRNGVPVGCITLYSGTLHAFDEDARNLLTEMADDISFALDNFTREQERRRAIEELRIAATAFQAQEGMAITDAARKILRVNNAFSAITGYAADEILGRPLGLLASAGDAGRGPPWNGSLDGDCWQGEVWNRRKNGEMFPSWMIVTAVRNEVGTLTHFVATVTDTSRIKQSEEEIRYLAFYDPLTRLPNRRLLLDRLQQALAAASRSGREGALLFIDLDNFKTVNDTLGHDIGDLLLLQVAHRLTACLREGDTVARLGGDEFVVILEDLGDNPAISAIQAETVGNKILATLAQPFRLERQDCYCTASIGVTLFGNLRGTKEETLKQADLAMYQAKAAGPNVLRFFDPGMQAAVSTRASLEADLRQGLRQNAFFLCYQVQVDHQGRPTGAEVLARWRHPERGVVSPAEFIPVAEDTGLILPLGRLVLEEACRQLVAWETKPGARDLTLSVNVSARQFRQADFVGEVLAVLAETGANPAKLKLELTESLVLDDIEEIIAKMAELGTHGVEFSFDDFGTGYSSLGYLRRLPLRQLKVDRSFVTSVHVDAGDAAIVRTIVALASNLGLDVIAEGVETAEQRDFLKGLGCAAFQGFLFGRPQTLTDFESSLGL
ncbi:MAG: EAL domain-containing protein [Telmatospirillum sp.]|nr:EAL domain-containing protein [Telmatospirillum sp.]